MFIRRNNILAALVLLICGFYPLAWLNDTPLTLYPVFHNFISDYRIWDWIDIAAFSLTHTLILLGFIIFGWREQIFILRTLSVLLIINSLIILFIIFLKSIQADQFSDIGFSLGFGWFLMLFAFLISLTNYRKLSPRK